MPDPLAINKSDTKLPDLFDLLPAPSLSTRQQGRVAAVKSRSKRVRQILDLLVERGPLAGWQLADAIGCQLYQVSGRLSEMKDDRLIEVTGERRKNPRTGVNGEVVRLAGLNATELNFNETFSA